MNENKTENEIDNKADCQTNKADNGGFEIRRCQIGDLEAFRRICIETALEPVPEERRNILTLLYCDYYVEQESENCLALVLDGQVVGYTLCGRNRDFLSKMKSLYLPKVSAIDEKQARDFLRFQRLLKIFFGKYRAHLHIDILPQFQRCGYGSKLIDALLKNLALQGEERVMLVCSANNQKGLSFYRKYGFKELFSMYGGVGFGIQTSHK